MAGIQDTFDAVIFFAVLEHMLPDERLLALSTAWNIVRPGGYVMMGIPLDCLFLTGYQPN